MQQRFLRTEHCGQILLGLELAMSFSHKATSVANTGTIDTEFSCQTCNALDGCASGTASKYVPGGEPPASG